jgi:phage host-nuclease inhibitor protein Gam
LPTKTAPPKVQRILQAIDPDVQEMRRLERRMDEIEAERAAKAAPIEAAILPFKEKLSEIELEAAAQRQPLKDAYEQLETKVKRKAERNEGSLVDFFKKKTIPFLSGGRVKIRNHEEKLDFLVDEQEVAVALREAGFPDLTEEKLSVIVDALKKNDEALEAVEGMVEITRDKTIKVELE